MKTKHAHFGDTHIVKGPRWDELCRIDDWIVEDLASWKPDIITHGGDVFHRDTIPSERNYAHDFVMKLARIAPVVIVRGNHDPLGEIEVFGKLRSKYPIIIEEVFGIHETDKAIVVGIAWPRKAELLSRLSADASLKDSDEAASEGMRHILRGLGMQLDTRFEASPKPRILVMHAMVRGSITSTGQPLVGCDFEAGIEDLFLARCDFVALSHIHKGQEFRVNDMPIVYPGSTYRTNYGEIEQKGYLQVEYDNRKPSWDLRLTPATPMLLLEGIYDPEQLSSDNRIVGGIVFDDIPGSQLKWRGADIRLRYKVEAEHRENAAKAAEFMEQLMLNLGAVKVTIEEVKITHVRARMPEIAEAGSTSDKLQIYWKSKNIVPVGTLKDGLLDKLHQLELEAMEA